METSLVPSVLQLVVTPPGYTSVAFTKGPFPGIISCTRQVRFVTRVINESLFFLIISGAIAATAK